MTSISMPWRTIMTLEEAMALEVGDKLRCVKSYAKANLGDIRIVTGKDPEFDNAPFIDMGDNRPDVMRTTWLDITYDKWEKVK
jgi:hypothetical protein